MQARQSYGVERFGTEQIAATEQRAAQAKKGLLPDMDIGKPKELR